MFKRNYVSIAAMALVAVPATVGVYNFMALYRAGWVAFLAAVGIELTYLSLSAAVLNDEGRKRAQWLALATAMVSILCNFVVACITTPATFAGYAWGWQAGLAALDSVPLPAIAFVLAWMLLHPQGAAKLTATPEPPTVSIGNHADSLPIPSAALPIDTDSLADALKWRAVTICDAPGCDFVAASPNGLQAHRRVHTNGKITAIAATNGHVNP